jgi:7-cyano-7-deazaguanine synthase in queuosine biosynthesis
MKRCSVIGLAYPKDHVIPVNNDSIVILIELPKVHSQTKYGVGAFINKTKPHLISPNLLASELLNLSALVYAADTRISRQDYSQDGWTREFDIYFPVNKLKVWEPLTTKIEDLLSFITGDFWNIHLRERDIDHQLEIAAASGTAIPVKAVSLLSGGLDSFIGAIDLLTDKTDALFVGHYTKDGTQNYQISVEEVLRKEFPSNFKGYVKGCIVFDKNVFNTSTGEVRSENSQRSRSFMFLAMAAYLASAMDSKCKLIVPENGFIALNVPLDPLRLGANSTKTVHPNFMVNMAEIFNELSLMIELVNPYRHMTKGEMMTKCKAKRLLVEHGSKTLSCASQSKMRWDKGGLKAKRLGGAGGNGNCGYCYPCLIRKASFQKSGISDNTNYVAISNLSQAKIKSGKGGAVYAESKDILSVQYAGYRLENGMIKPRIEIHKSGTINGVYEEWDDIAGMYDRGLREVYALVKDVTVVKSH